MAALNHSFSFQMPSAPSSPRIKTDPVRMTIVNELVVEVTLRLLAGGGHIEAWLEWSDEREQWFQLAASEKIGAPAVLRFAHSGPGVSRLTAALSAREPGDPVGVRFVWIRFAYQFSVVEPMVGTLSGTATSDTE
jgi:hypothetical protein